MECFGINPEDGRTSGEVRTIVFIAAHLPLSDVDAVILREGARSLHNLPPPHGPARMWVLLHAEAIGETARHEAEVAATRTQALLTRCPGVAPYRELTPYTVPAFRSWPVSGRWAVGDSPVPARSGRTPRPSLGSVGRDVPVDNLDCVEEPARGRRLSQSLGRLCARGWRPAPAAVLLYARVPLPLGGSARGEAPLRALLLEACVRLLTSPRRLASSHAAASVPISPHCLLSAPHLAPSSQPTSSRHRLETDALFSGSYGALLASTGGSDADLVLHKYSTEKRTGWYPHWNNNRELLADVPARYAVEREGAR